MAAVIGEFEIEHPIYLVDGVRRCTAMIGSTGNTCAKIDIPVMQGTGDGMFANNALRQCPPLVWTSVTQGKQLIMAITKNRDIAKACAHYPRPQRRYLRQLSYFHSHY